MRYRGTVAAVDHDQDVLPGDVALVVEHQRRVFHLLAHHQPGAEAGVVVHRRARAGDSHAEQAEHRPAGEDHRLVLEVPVGIAEVLPGLAEDGDHVERGARRAGAQPGGQRLPILVERHRPGPGGGEDPAVEVSGATGLVRWRGLGHPGRRARVWAMNEGWWGRPREISEGFRYC